MDGAPEHFFFYGTLQDVSLSDTARAVLPRLERVGTGSTSGRLVAITGESVVYPALLRTEDAARVRGTCFRIGPAFSADDLVTLDEYEDFDPAEAEASEYLREAVRVVLDDGQEVPAWTYVWRGSAPSGSKAIPSGDFLAYRAALTKG